MNETFRIASLLRFPKNEAILDGHGTCLMPAMSIFQKLCFFKKWSKNLTNFEKIPNFFLHFLLQFYTAFQWYIICFHTPNTFGCTNQHVNQEIVGYAPLFQWLYIAVQSFFILLIEFDIFAVLSIIAVGMLFCHFWQCRRLMPDFISTLCCQNPKNLKTAPCSY